MCSPFTSQRETSGVGSLQAGVPGVKLQVMGLFFFFYTTDPSCPLNCLCFLIKFKTWVQHNFQKPISSAGLFLCWELNEGLILHTFNSSTEGADASGSVGVWGQLGLHSEVLSLKKIPVHKALDMHPHNKTLMSSCRSNLCFYSFLLSWFCQELGATTQAPSRDWLCKHTDYSSAHLF